MAFQLFLNFRRRGQDCMSGGMGGREQKKRDFRMPIDLHCVIMLKNSLTSPPQGSPNVPVIKAAGR